MIPQVRVSGVACPDAKEKEYNVGISHPPKGRMDMLMNNYKKIFVMSQSKRSKGFTLIELLIVVAIIGVLATVITVSFSSIRAKSRGNVAKSDVQAMMTDYEAYKAAHINLSGIIIDDGDEVGDSQVSSGDADWTPYWRSPNGFNKTSNNPYQPPSDDVIYTLKQSENGRKYVICAEGADVEKVQSSGQRAFVAQNSETFADTACPPVTQPVAPPVAE